MGEHSAIEWTDATDNIIVAADGGWWCHKISPGCTFCYAEKLNDSTYFKGNHRKYSGEAPPMKLREDIIDGWARKRKPAKRFVCSMTDVLGEWVPFEWIVRYLDGMAAAPLQTFQLLTKRADRLFEATERWLKLRGRSVLPANIWAMVSVEDQERASERVPWLLRTRAQVRGLSVEPLLGPIDLSGGEDPATSPKSYLSGEWDWIDDEAGICRMAGIDWVIVGGESGPKARPMHPAWVRSIHAQCSAAGVPFFFKQHGTWIAIENKDPRHAQRWSIDHLRREMKLMRVNGEMIEWDGRFDPLDGDSIFVKVGKKSAGRELDGRPWSEFPL